LEADPGRRVSRPDFTIDTIAAVGEEGDPAPRETAASLAASLGATVVPRAVDETGLVVVGSKPGTAAGRVTLSAAAQYLIEMLLCPVLVLPHGVALRSTDPASDQAMLSRSAPESTCDAPPRSRGGRSVVGDARFEGRRSLEETNVGLPPELVRLPSMAVPDGARLIRLRLPDRPGSLARITERFAAHRVDVLRLEVVGREGGWAIDDFLLGGPSISDALADLGPEVVVLADREGVDLADPGLAMAAACASVTFAESRRDAYAQLLAAALGLAFAEAGFVCVRESHGFLRPVASTVAGLPVIEGDVPSLLLSALHGGESVTADSGLPWAPASYLDRVPHGAVAAVPGGDPAFLVLVLVRRDDAPFVQAELSRLDALVTVAVGTLRLHEANLALTRSHGASFGWSAARPNDR
jgi:hypothetical protein